MIAPLLLTRRSRRLARSLRVAVVLIVAGGFAAPAAADPPTCLRAVNSSLAKFTQGKIKYLGKCNEAVLQGKRPGPCPDTATTERITRLAGKLRRDVSKRCGGLDRNCGLGGDDETLASIGWDMGSCPNLESGSCTNGIGDCNDIVDCVSCVAEFAVDQTVALSYDALAPSVPGSTFNRCQASIGRGMARFFSAKSKALAKCEDKVIKGQLAGPCPDGLKTVPKIVRAADKLERDICRACGGADRICGGSGDLSPAMIGFPANCNDVTVPGGGPACGGAVGTLQQLVDCVACVTEFKADCLDALGVPTLKSYPAECSLPVPTLTATPTKTVTPTPVGATPTPTRTPTRTPTPTPTPTNTSGETPAPTITRTPTPTPTVTMTPAGTPTPTLTATQTTTPTQTPTPTPTATPNCGDGVIVPPETCETGIPCGITNNCIACLICL